MTDIEISNRCNLLDINYIASRLGINSFIEPYGSYKAKIDYTKIKELQGTILMKATGKNKSLNFWIDTF